MQQVTANSPDTLPAYGQDVFNYLAAYYASNHQLHMVLTFNKHINQNLMAKAIRVTMDIEPILGCNFVEHPEKAYFKRRTDLDILELCPILKIESPDTALKKFIAKSIDSRYDPLVIAQIFRTNSKDIVCIKLDHTVSDGSGLKEYTYLLSNVYSKLCTQSAYSMTTAPSRRDAAHLLESLGIDNPSRAWQPPNSPPEKAWSFPAEKRQNQQPVFSMHQIPKEQFLTIKELAKKQDATINDVLLTLYYRALFKITNTAENQAQPIAVTADLRHHNPNSAAIIAANVSSSFNTLLVNKPDECFLDTLSRVSQITAEIKQTSVISRNALFFEFLGNLNFNDANQLNAHICQLNNEANTFPPFLSNLGVIDNIIFGDNAVLEAYAVTPAMFTPLFMLGASTYKDVLTIALNYFSSDIKCKDIQNFFHYMITDLESIH